MQKTCSTCGATFTGRAERTYCSRPCAYQARTLPDRPCQICGKPCDRRFPNARTCSRQCGFELRCRIGTATRKIRASQVRFPDCTVCGKTFCTRNGKAKMCSAECKRIRILSAIAHKYATDPDHRARSLAAAHSRRAQKLGLGGPEILLTYLIDRDSGQCRIPNCHFKTRKVTPLGSKGPRRPSIDHVIPLSLGGQHDLTNVQLAHARCNLSKHNRGSGDQLALVG